MFMVRTHTHSLIVGMSIIALLMSGLLVTAPAHAHGGDTASSTAKSSIKINKITKQVNASCMQTAIATRESSLLTAFSAFHDDIEEALSDRKDALNTAWGLSEGKSRNTALTTAWKTWKTAHKSATTDFKTSRKSAWDTFKATVKDTCKVSLPKDEGLSADAAGSISI